MAAYLHPLAKHQAATQPLPKYPQGAWEARALPLSYGRIPSPSRQTSGSHSTASQVPAGSLGSQGSTPELWPHCLYPKPTGPGVKPCRVSPRTGRPSRWYNRAGRAQARPQMTQMMQVESRLRTRALDRLCAEPSIRLQDRAPCGRAGLVPARLQDTGPVKLRAPGPDTRRDRERYKARILLRLPPRSKQRCRQPNPEPGIQQRGRPPDVNYRACIHT